MKPVTSLDKDGHCFVVAFSKTLKANPGVVSVGKKNNSLKTLWPKKVTYARLHCNSNMSFVKNTVSDTSTYNRCSG